MIKLVVTNEKNLELYELEKVHVGENKFGFYLIFLPEVLNGFALSECNVELVQVLADNTSVSINIDTTQQIRPIQKNITLDVTATAQTVTLSMLITHNGDIIGKTNQVTFEVHPTKNATPIDPREDLDEIIAELRADKAELEETVSEQAAEITEKTARITELSNQVDNLTEETTEQAETIERQETTIDQLNSRVPKMYTPPIVTPSGITQQITPPPDEDYDGLTSVTVDRVTAAVDSDIMPENIKEGVDILGVAGTYNPFPEHSYGGIYFVDWNDYYGVPEQILIKNYTSRVSFGSTNLMLSIYLRKLLFENCTGIYQISGYLTWSNLSSLEEVRLPEKLERVVDQFFLHNNTKLKKINIPSTLISIASAMLRACSALQDVTIENGFNCNNLDLSSSTLYSHDTILSWFNALADRTGQTAYTLTIGTTNLNKMTTEEKAIATNKNWNLA